MPDQPEQARDTAHSLEQERAELIALRTSLDCLDRAMWQYKVRRADVTARLMERDRWIQEVRDSWAWKLIKPLWKLQRHFSKRDRISKQNSVELVFAVDPFETLITPPNVLRLTGWCFSHGGPEIAGVRARIDGKSYFARYGLRRGGPPPGILEYPAALHSGFSVDVPMPAEDSTIVLEAIAQGGSWQCFFSQSRRRFIPANPRSNEKISTPTDNDKNENVTVVLYPNIEIKDVATILRTLGDQHSHRIASGTPFFSVITPFFHVQPRWIVEAGNSLLIQSFPDWEWYLLLPPSSDSAWRQLFEQLADADGRLRLLPQKDNGPSEAINLALDAVAGDAVCFLDPQDLLHPEFLAAMAGTLRDYDLAYPDEDKFDEQTGRRKEALYKPDWSPEYLRGTMYLGRGLSVRRDLARRIRFNSDYDGIHYFEFMLRATETGARVGHIPRALYHSRKMDKPATPPAQNESDAELLQERAVNQQLQRLNLPARAERTTPGRLRMVPALRASYPKISVIIPTKDAPELLSRCLESLHHHTIYPAFETVLVDNETTNPEALAVMNQYRVTRAHLPGPFNFSSANNRAVKHAIGEYLVFLNNDTEVVAARWLDHLLYYAEQPDVGAAGALLLHDDSTVQHAGVIIGMGGTADHALRGFSAKSDGYLGSLSCAREVSAVTAACMMMRRSLFEELGGFNEQFSTMYQDVDLCLRIRERRLRIIFTPQALLLHHESLSRSKYYDDADRQLLLGQWQQAIQCGDPYYNPNLNLERGDYGRR